jgi:hypothetical protein
MWILSREPWHHYQRSRCEIASLDSLFRSGRNTMGTKQVILWPAEYKTGNIIYPYGEAKKK